MIRQIALLLTVTLPLLSCTHVGDNDAPQAAKFDVLVVNGMVYDGQGGTPYQADIGIKADRIVTIGMIWAVLKQPLMQRVSRLHPALSTCSAGPLKA